MRTTTALALSAAPILLAALAMPQLFSPQLSTPSSNRASVAAVAAAPSFRGSVHVPDRGDGHFEVSGRIGARRIPFIVDTGATVVALSWQTGRDLGLVQPGDAMTVPVTTANGQVNARSVLIPRLSVDNVDVDQVAALVLPEGALQGNLLGMSFLSRLKHVEVSQGTLVLEQ